MYSRRLTPALRAKVDGATGPLALGPKGSVRNRLTPSGRVPGSALGVIKYRCAGEVWRLRRQYKCDCPRLTTSRQRMVDLLSCYSQIRRITASGRFGIYGKTGYYRQVPKFFTVCRSCIGPTGQMKLALILSIKRLFYCQLTDPE